MYRSQLRGSRLSWETRRMRNSSSYCVPFSLWWGNQGMIHHALRILGKEEAMEKKTLLSRGATRAGWRIPDRKSSARVQVSHGQGKAGEGSPRGPERVEEEDVTAGWPHLTWEQGQRLGRPLGAVGTSSSSQKDWFPTMLLFFPRPEDRWSQQAGVEGWTSGIFSCTVKAVKAEGAQVQRKKGPWHCDYRRADMTGECAFETHYEVSHFMNHP